MRPARRSGPTWGVEGIILFYLYTKAKSETLTAAQLKSLKVAVAVIKQQFRP